jgi:hypothetical protein
MDYGPVTGCPEHGKRFSGSIIFSDEYIQRCIDPGCSDSQY